MLKDPMFRDRIGGFDLKKTENETPTTVTALLQEHTSDRFSRLVLQVEATEPHRIVSFDMHPVERPAEFALKPMTEAELIAALGKRMQEEVAGDKFSGAVLVAKNGKPIFAQAYGLADREHNIPDTLTTRFSIGSMNKMFTGVAVLQLAQAGKLKLDDPLGKYLTNYPNKELAAKVTISELLTNTGGTGDIGAPITTSIASSCAPCRTISTYMATARSASSQVAAGNTAITASSCSAQSLRRSAARATTITYASTSTSPQG